MNWRFPRSEVKPPGNYKATNLTADKLADREAKLEELQERLEEQIKEEERQSKIDQLKNCAKKATKLEKQYREKFAEIDKILSKEIPELHEISMQWKSKTDDFKKVVYEFEDASIINRIENKGTDLDSVLSQIVGPGSIMVDGKPTYIGRGKRKIEKGEYASNINRMQSSQSN